MLPPRPKDRGFRAVEESVNLRLADDLILPAEAATQTFLIVGKRGSGKTTTAVRLAEQFIRAGVPIVVVDPVDRWWGLKASHDGTGPGLNIYVFGGEHADLPLEAGAGAMIADALVEYRISAVLSVKHFSGHERGRFVADLTGRLFQRNKEPLHVFLEEAHEVAPQQPFRGEEEMLGRVTRLWKLGRSSGLGGSAITQRPASLSKNITTQAEILIVHRTLGPQDIAAIREWIRYHGEREDILGQLATLRTGEAFVWAPDFPESKAIGLQRVKILNRDTFDSSATPKVGQRSIEPKILAPVDLERLRERMAATIERAKAQDPRELQKLVATLQQELRDRAKEKLAAREPRVEVPVLKEGQLKRVEALMARVEGVQERLAAVLGEAVRGVWDLRQAVRTAAPARPASPPEPRRAAAEPAPRPMYSGRGSGDLTGPQRKLLTALAQHGDRSTTALALLTGYAHTGGAFRNPLSALRSLGYADGRETVRITDAGLRALGSWDPLPTGSALLAWWIGHLPGPESKLLRAAADAYPKAISVEELARATGYEASGGAFRNPLSRLRTLSLVSGRAEVRVAEELFG